MVRAKFTVEGKMDVIDGGDILTTVNLRAIYDPDPNSENGQFWKWTPGGEIRLSTINKHAADQFELGKQYYVDFTPAN